MAPPAPPGYRIRTATAADAPVLARQRRAMFDAMGMLDGGSDSDALETVAKRWIEQHIAAGTFHSWLVETAAGAIVAGGGLQLRELMPRPGFVRGEPEALILSMWTDPDHRRRGLGTAVVREMLAWCRSRGIRRITLHASPQGKPIYTRLGFEQTNEMRLELPED